MACPISQGGPERRAASGSGRSEELRIVLRRTTRRSGTLSLCATDQVRLRLLFVVEETTLADDLSHLGRDHFIPALVPAGDPLEHVPRKDRQIFRVEIIELHKAAAANQVIIKRLQVGFYLERVDGF